MRYILSPLRQPIASLARSCPWVCALAFATAFAYLPGAALAQETATRSIRIAGYDYTLPSWWDAVKVDIPESLKDSKQLQEFVTKQYGDDVGVKATWKEAAKTYAIWCQRFNDLPVFVAHCHCTGEDYARAAEIYGNLYKLADTQGTQQHWHRCFLAYNAGKMYALLKDTDNAKLWYSRSAEYVGRSGDPAISYYAKESAGALRNLQTVSTVSHDGSVPALGPLCFGDDSATVLRKMANGSAFRVDGPLPAYKVGDKYYAVVLACFAANGENEATLKQVRVLGGIFRREEDRLSKELIETCDELRTHFDKQFGAPATDVGSLVDYRIPISTNTVVLRRWSTKGTLASLELSSRSNDEMNLELMISRSNQEGPAKGRQPVPSETNRTSSLARPRS